MPSDDKDVLGKADALLRRHAPAAGEDAVPVLTDFIDGGPGGGPAAAPPDLVREVRDQVLADLDARLAGLRQELARTVEEAVRRALERRDVK